MSGGLQRHTCVSFPDAQIPRFHVLVFPCFLEEWGGGVSFGFPCEDFVSLGTEKREISLTQEAHPRRYIVSQYTLYNWERRAD